MRLSVLAIGRLKAGPERELVERYAARASALTRPLGFGALDTFEFPESRSQSLAIRRQDEASLLLAKKPSGRLVVFDEKGRSLDSQAFARMLAQWRDQGEPATSFVIGGPDGLDERVRTQADLVLSFGALTLPHQIVRILVFEQIYRAMTLLAGHPYHRE